eukprot:gene18619-biopygen23430
MSLTRRREYTILGGGGDFGKTGGSWGYRARFPAFPKDVPGHTAALASPAVRPERSGAWQAAGMCRGPVLEGVRGQIPAVHGSNVRFDSVNGKIGPRRVGGTKRTPSAEVSAVSRDSPAAYGRSEPADRLFFRVLEQVPRDLLLSRREAPRAGARAAAAARARSRRANDMDEIRE